MLVSRRRGVGKAGFTKKLLKSKLIAPPLERTVRCYTKHQWKWKWTWNTWKVFLESWASISRRTNEISLYWMILWIKHQRVLILLNCLHVVVMIIYLTQNMLHKNQRAPILNSNYIVIFKNLGYNSQFATIARQMHPDKVKFPMWA